MVGIEFLGWAGFGILVAAWIPQTWETIKAGNTQMNIAFIIMYFSSSLMLTIYSVLIDDTVFTALNALLTLGSGINLFYKLFPRTKS
ncbi:PQ-loop domain-containing transporter [Gracilimonas sp.]|uniref:PQ-loop domain-containing transporter n=1 Tax=Gracilimonas sp. TaxID=1974203 RepID=UPI002870F800|nr:PQ-loop domain-containing transporter [Gracilimonas sp.]